MRPPKNSIDHFLHKFHKIPYNIFIRYEGDSSPDRRDFRSLCSTAEEYMTLSRILEFPISIENGSMRFEVLGSNPKDRVMNALYLMKIKKHWW